MDNKTWFEFTPAERKKRATLTPVEGLLVADLLKAVKALPRSIVLEVTVEGLDVRKRITRGSTVIVATLRKKSLKF